MDILDNNIIQPNNDFDSKIVYDNAIVEKMDEYGLYGSTLQKLADKDYGKKDAFKHDIKCIDADKLKSAKFPCRKNVKSVDAIIGISDFFSNNTHNTRLLFVELRLKVGSKNNISCDEFVKKVNGTKNCLKKTTKCDNKTIFIFSDRFIQVAKSLFNRFRIQGGDSKFFYAWSISEFNNTVHDLNGNFENKVKFNQKDIYNKLKKDFEERDFSGLCKSVKYWIEIAKKERKHYNIHEFNNIIQALSEFKTYFDAQDVDKNSNDYINLLVLFEDVI